MVPRKRFTAHLLVLMVLILTAGATRAEMPLETTPYYTSLAQSQVATGGGWADVDGDGWIDMVVANGNDISRQRVAIYHNLGDGSFPATPTWTSDDVDYHGHLDLGDINGDGLVDVAVGVYLGPNEFGDPGTAKVYLNDGAGGFSTTPDWVSAVDFFCFRVALGDADGDGDLDLACSSGESYGADPERQRIFYNNNGALESFPSWLSDEIGYALDVRWVDVDLDGDLDLAFSGEGNPNRVYLNGQTTGGGISTTADWESGDGSSYANTIAFGDWNDDGYPEFGVADNYQLGGTGRFKVYSNLAGTLATQPDWTSVTGGYGSHVSWVDLDLDGDPDLAAGRWWSSAKIYENVGGDLSSTPVWTSATSSVIENCFWGDADNDGLRLDGLSLAYGDGARTCVKLGHAPIRSVNEVRIEGIPLPPSDYVAYAAGGWISLAAAPPPGSEIEVRYAYSHDLELGITNWDSGIGNYVFRNTSSLTVVADFNPATFELSAKPNPVHRRTVLRYLGEGAGQASLVLFDVRGRRVRSLHQGPLTGGLVTWEWDARNSSGRRVARGVYFARFVVGNQMRTVKLTVM